MAAPHPEPPNRKGVPLRWRGNLNPATVRRGHRHRLLVLLPIVLALLIGTALSARPAYTLVKRWRADRLAGQSLQLLKTGQESAAWDKARAAFLLNSRDPDVLRAVARVLMQQGKFLNALNIWQRLLHSGSAEVDDFRQAATAALRTTRLSTAEAFLKKLPTGSQPTAGDELLRARTSFRQGAFAEAEKQVQRALRLEPGKLEAQVLLEQIRLRNSESHASAEARLLAISGELNEAGLQALRALADDAQLSPAYWAQVGAGLPAHPQATPADALRSFALELRGQPENRADLLRAATAKYETAAPPVLCQFARVLLTAGEPERVLGMITAARAASRVDLLLVYVDALAVTGDWAALLEFLQRRQLPLPRVANLLLQARCNEQLGQPRRAAELWELTFRVCAGNTELLTQVADYADKVGQTREAALARTEIARLAKPGEAYE